MWIIWDNPSFASGSILADMPPSTHAIRWSTNGYLSLSTSWRKKNPLNWQSEADEGNVHYFAQYYSIEKIGARVTSKVHEVQIQDPRPKPNLKCCQVTCLAWTWILDANSFESILGIQEWRPFSHKHEYESGKCAFGPFSHGVLWE